MAHKTVTPKLNLKYLGAVQIALCAASGKTKNRHGKTKIAAAKA